MGGTICWKGNVNPLTELESKIAELEEQKQELHGVLIYAIHYIIESRDGYGCPPTHTEMYCAPDAKCYDCWVAYFQQMLPGQKTGPQTPE